MLGETATELDRLNRGTQEAVEGLAMVIAAKDGEIRRLVFNTAGNNTDGDTAWDAAGEHAKESRKELEALLC